MDEDVRGAVGKPSPVRPRADAPLTPHEAALLEAALDYVRAGLPVFPCHAPLPGGSGRRCTCAPDAESCPKGNPGKHPRTADGFKGATLDEGIVRGWWGGAWRGSNVGLVAPSWAFILDIDVGAAHGNVNGFEALRDLEDEHGDLPETPRTWTGSGGSHVLMRLPEGVRHGNDRGALPAGLDVRGGAKGYIIAPPSLHASGNPYRWQTFLSPDHVEIAEVPAWLLEIVQRGKATGDDGEPFDVSTLPTQIPERIKRVLAAARTTVRSVKRMVTGHITSIVLARCPACGDTRGKCHVTPSGRLKSKREHDCPAGPAQAGEHGLSLVEWVGAHAPQATHALREPPPGQSKRPETDRLSIALAELAMRPEHDVEIGAWLHAAGVHPELRGAVFDAGLVVAGGGEGPSRLAQAIADDAPDASVLIGMRDVFGAVRCGFWADADGGLRPVRVRGLESVADLHERLAVFGDVPSTVAAARDGGRIVLTVGALDYLTACGLVEAGLLDAVVVGVRQISDIGPLGKYLGRLWQREGVIPTRLCLVAGGVEQSRIDDATKPLAGRAGVYLCELTTRRPPSGAIAGRGGALHASAWDFGVDSVARSIRTAPCLHPPPIPMDGASEAVRAALLDAVRESLYTTTHGRRRLVIFQVDPGVGKTTAALRLAAEVAAGRVPMVPVNGRRPRGVEGDAWPPQGRRVGMWLPKHSLADEKHLQAAGPEMRLHELADFVRLKGALEWCRFANNVRGMFPAVGRRGICGDEEAETRCPHADDCPGAVEPSIRFGEVGIGAHAMAPNITQDLCFLDEDPGVLDETVVEGETIATLFASRILPSVKRWRTATNPEAGEAAKMLVSAVEALANDHAAACGSGLSPPYSRYISADELSGILGGVDRLIQTMRRGFAADATEPPVPGPNELRAGSYQIAAYPSRPAFRALRELLAWYERRSERAEPLVVIGAEPRPPKPVASIEVRPDRTWAIHILRPKRLPNCPVVVLDATGDLVAGRWRDAYPDRDVRLVPLRVAGPPPTQAIHLRSKMLSRGRVFGPDGRLTVAGALRVRSAILRAVGAARGQSFEAPGTSREIGVLVYKTIHDIATGVREPQAYPEHRIRGLDAEIREMGLTPVWGYFGAHDRATNVFERVDALCVVGDPLANIGAMQMQAQALGSDADEMGKALAQATLIQAVFRARHTRRPDSAPVAVVYAGAVAPTVAGLDWTVEPLYEPGRRRSGGAETAAAAVAHVAAELGDVVGLKIVRAWEFTDDDVGHDAQVRMSDGDIQAAVAALAKTRGLVRVTARTSRGHDGFFFAPSEASGWVTVTALDLYK